MKCRTCGTEIADKAIVCYRCGAGTMDPVRTPAPIGRRPGGGPPLAAGVLPLLVALVLLYLAQGSAHADALDASAGGAAVAGVLLLIIRTVRRR